MRNSLTVRSEALAKLAQLSSPQFVDEEVDTYFFDACQATLPGVVDTRLVPKQQGLQTSEHGRQALVPKLEESSFRDKAVTDTCITRLFASSRRS